MTPVTIRLASTDDWPAIKAMRDARLAEMGESVTIPVNTIWWAAEVGGEVRACAGLCFVTADDHPNSVIITDVYDDGSFHGKRAMIAFFKEAAASKFALHTTVGYDRLQLAEALIKRCGFRATGIALERPGAQRGLVEHP